MADSQAAALPRYQSHKKVWALKIAAIEFDESGVAKIAPVEKGYTTIETLPGYRAKFHGSEEDLGYYVVYEDDYASWSPTQAFEEGYTRV